MKPFDQRVFEKNRAANQSIDDDAVTKCEKVILLACLLPFAVSQQPYPSLHYEREETVRRILYNRPPQYTAVHSPTTHHGVFYYSYNGIAKGGGTRRTGTTGNERILVGSVLTQARTSRQGPRTDLSNAVRKAPCFTCRGIDLSVDSTRLW